MQRLSNETPDSWKTKTTIYKKKFESNADYNYERSYYENSNPIELELCWQPGDDSIVTSERGETLQSSYTAVIFGSVELSYGDMVVINGLGTFLISSIKKYPSHRLVTVISTDRRIDDVKA